MRWVYHGSDPGLRLFTSCLESGAPMPMQTGARVLQIGCCEADWLHLAAEAWPTAQFTGVDCRAPDVVDAEGRVTRMRANALDPDLFAPERFDAIVSLSAIGHVGLGHYGDPRDPAGDALVMGHCWRWLKPGGWVYFDVPYDPTRHYFEGTECRVYDDAALRSRLQWSPWTERFCGYAAANNPGVLVPPPTDPHRRYWYTARVWTKE